MIDPTDNQALKCSLINLIGAAIDETSAPGVENSFVEMENAVIHYAGDGGERYFRVLLIESDGSDYFEFYNPERLLP